MKTEYAVEVYNKIDDSFAYQLDVFPTYQEALRFATNGNIKVNPSEYIGILEIEYDEKGNENGVNRVFKSSDM